MPDYIVKQAGRVSARKKVIQNTGLLPMARVLYVYLDDLAHETGVTECARWTISQAIGVSVRNVSRLLDQLQVAGALHTERGSDRERHVLSWAVQIGHRCPIRRGHRRPLDRTPVSYQEAPLKSLGIRSIEAPVSPNTKPCPRCDAKGCTFPAGVPLGVDCEQCAGTGRIAA